MSRAWQGFRLDWRWAYFRLFPQVTDGCAAECFASYLSRIDV
jgi:hypothetical protein